MFAAVLSFIVGVVIGLTVGFVLGAGWQSEEGYDDGDGVDD